MLNPVKNELVREPDGYAEKSRDFLELEIAETVHFNSDPRPLGQFGHRFPQMRIFILVERNGFRGRRFVRRNLNRHAIIARSNNLPLPSRTLALIEREIASDAIKISFRILQRPPFGSLIEPQPGFLRQVFSDGAIPCEAISVINQGAAMRQKYLKRD